MNTTFENPVFKDFFELKKNLKKDFSGCTPIKIAVLGDSATQFLVQALGGMGFEYNFNLQIWEANFNQIERQIFDASSDFYKFKPEVVIIFKSSHKLLNKYNKLLPEQYFLLASMELENIRNIYLKILEEINIKIIYYNYTEIDDSVYGNFANQLEESFLFQLRKLNFHLMEFASKNTNFYLCDICTIQNSVGKSSFFHPSIYINSDMVLSIYILPRIAAKTIDIICTFNGRFKKCIILDLDNTIWGGIIGDDGIENIQIGCLGIGKAFSEFQYWLKKLKTRGVILAVCSKNLEAIAKEPFEKHPEMILKLDDFAVFVANWHNKPENIKLIQKKLNIDFRSMVFLDDNPFERNIVRENIPEICVPELPEDPAEYLECLYKLNLFETSSTSKIDIERTKFYQNDSKRSDAKLNFTDEADFLKSLNMYSIVESFNAFNKPRVAQLSQRSNQFNLRTIRYTESDVEILCKTPDKFTFTFTLEDKFGDNGLICAVVLCKVNASELFVENWFMSCRVLNRSLENFVLNTIVDSFRNTGFTRIKGEYIITLKNELVKDHYKNLGFKKFEMYWILDLNEYQSKTTYVKLKL